MAAIMECPSSWAGTALMDMTAFEVMPKARSRKLFASLWLSSLLMLITPVFIQYGISIRRSLTRILRSPAENSE